MSRKNANPQGRVEMKRAQTWAESYRHVFFQYIQRDPNSTLFHVSSNPPAIPDGRISRVRSAAVCTLTAFPWQVKLKCRPIYNPTSNGLPVMIRYGYLQRVRKFLGILSNYPSTIYGIGPIHQGSIISIKSHCNLLLKVFQLTQRILTNR